MKNISQNFNNLFSSLLTYPLISAIMISLILLITGFYFLISIHQKTINEQLEITTKRVEKLWRAVTSAHEETMQAYFMQYIMREEVLNILKKANSDDAYQQALARTELLRKLWDSYHYLNSNLFVRQLHFHLPNNISFLRFHSPSQYGDDLTEIRPTVSLTNKLKKPQSGFETGRIMTGYRYVFPIIDSDGNHLGSVELSRPFEILRRALNEIEKDAGFKLLIREKDVMPKLIPDFMKYYSKITYLEGWVEEDPRRELPDAPLPLKEEFIRILNKQANNRKFSELVNSPNNATITEKLDDRYYTITAIKLKEMNKNEHSAVLLSIAPSQVITIELSSLKKRQTILLIFIFLFSVMTYLFLRQVSKTREKVQELDTITSTMGNGLFILDEKGFIKTLNDTASKTLGYSKEELIGKEICSILHKENHDKSPCQIQRAIQKKNNISFDDIFKKKDGAVVDVHVNLTPLKINGIYKGAVLVFVDISDRKALENHLYNLSITDALTSLYNRRFQLEMLINAKNHYDRYKQPFSVLMIDIDDFKKINDTFGHKTGDHVLQAIAEVLNENLRATDVISRWGGEEFLVLMPNTDLKNAQNVAERIRLKIEKLRLEKIPTVTVSIGVASYRDTETIENLITRADNAMYEAKALGKNRVNVAN